jgi:hypothetical protein
VAHSLEETHDQLQPEEQQSISRAVAFEGGVHTYDSFARALIAKILGRAIQSTQEGGLPEDGVVELPEFRVSARWSIGEADAGSKQKRKPCCIILTFDDGSVQKFGTCCDPVVS